MSFPLPKTDLLGRPQKDLERFGHGIAFACQLAEWMPPKVVPAAFWQLDVTDAAEPVALVACPCGSTPHARLLGPLVLCGCERGFFFEGARVYAFNSPTVTTPQEALDSEHEADGASEQGAVHREGASGEDCAP